MLKRRATVCRVAVGVVCVVSVTACASFGEDGDGDSIGRPPEVGRDAVDLAGVFDDAGVAVVESPAVAPGGGPGVAAPLELWSWQVDNLEREHVAGGGYLGAELDRLVDLGSAAGGLPLSFLVAAWLSDPPTPTAERALGLIGQQEWSEAPTVIFPTAVLVLFVADVVALSVDLGWPAPSGPAGFRSALGGAAAGAGTGICSTLSGWVNAVLGSLFDALTIDVDDDSVFGWLADIWNTAVSLAEAAISGLVEVLTAPIVGAIADGVAIVGTLAMLASMLQPWTLAVVPSAGAVMFAVGDEPDVAAGFETSADTNAPDVWPDVLVDCADAVGLVLPDLSSAAGATVGWEVVGFPELGREEGRDTVIGDDQRAGLRFVTGREDSGAGDEVVGYVAASAVVVSSTPSQLQALLSQLVTDAIPVEPFSAAVTALFESLTEPIFLALADLVQVHGAGTMQVIRHEIDPTRLFDARWTGLVFQFSTSTPDTLAAGATSEGAETRVIVPIDVVIEAGEIVRASASLVQHTSSFIVGRTVAGADGSGYAVILAEANRLTVSGTPTAVTIGGTTEERYETFVQSDLPSDVATFTRSGRYDSSLTVGSVTCASSGSITTGSASGGRFVTGYWLAADVADEAEALSRAGIELSERVLAATELPARPGDRSGLDGAIESLDRAVERFRNSVPAGCGIEPMLQWAGALRGRAGDA